MGFALEQVIADRAGAVFEHCLRRCQPSTRLKYNARRT